MGVTLVFQTFCSQVYFMAQSYLVKVLQVFQSGFLDHQSHIGQVKRPDLQARETILTYRQPSSGGQKGACTETNWTQKSYSLSRD